MTSLLDRARRLADDLLWQAAGEVDARGVIPPSHFAALADAGLYGIAVAAPEALPAVTEVLAGACLGTTFTWMQHHGPVRTLARLRDPRLADATAGRLRCGVALAGALPDPPLLWATREDGGWRLDGRAPLVTGWGLIDLVQVAARDVATAGAADTEAVIVSALLDARQGPGLTARPLALLAADASSTVQLRFDGVHLPDDRVSDATTRAAFLAGMTASSRVNGALALGVAGRCVRLISETGRADVVAQGLAAELYAARAALDAALAAATASTHPAARTRVSTAPVAPATLRPGAAATPTARLRLGHTPAQPQHEHTPGPPQHEHTPARPQHEHTPAPPQHEHTPARPQQGHPAAVESQQGAPAAMPGGAAARMAAARAAASELAHRAAGALVVATGSRALLDGHPAGRLLREACFTLVAAGRDEIRADLLGRMTTPREIDVPGV